MVGVAIARGEDDVPPGFEVQADLRPYVAAGAEAKDGDEGKKDGNDGKTGGKTDDTGGKKDGKKGSSSSGYTPY